MTYKTVDTIRQRCAGALLFLYKRLVSPLLHAIPGVPGACRFQPTCSEYAAVALAEYGILRGSLMALHRLARCHPLHPAAFDPVPPKPDASTPHPLVRPTQ